MAVGQHQHAVVKAFELVRIAVRIAEVRCRQLQIERVHGEAADGISSQIDFPNLIDQVRNRSNRQRGEIRDHHEHVAVGQQLDALERIQRRGVVGVGPDHVPLQVGGECLGHILAGPACSTFRCRAAAFLRRPEILTGEVAGGVPVVQVRSASLKVAPLFSSTWPRM